MGEKTTRCIQSPELSRAKPPSPPCPETPTLRAPLQSHHEPLVTPFPPAPLWDVASEQLPGPWLRPDRAAHLSSCAAPALRLLFATEKLGGRENFSSRPRQELKTYALAANASPGARGDQGEPSAGFSTAAPAGAQPSCQSWRSTATPGLGVVTARSAPPAQCCEHSGMQGRMAPGLQHGQYPAVPCWLRCRAVPLLKDKPWGQMAPIR